MNRPLRFAVLVDIAVSTFQEQPLQGILSYAGQKGIETPLERADVEPYQEKRKKKLDSSIT